MLNNLQNAWNSLGYQLGTWLGVPRGGSNGYSGFDAEMLDPISWDTVAARMKRYTVYEGYYSNRIYYNRQLMSMLQQSRPKLYKYVRGIYNPVARLTALYTAKVYGGMLDMERARDGAIPMTDIEDALIEPITRLWEHSNWQREKVRYVRGGVKFGDTFIKVIDSPDVGKVRLENVDPRKVIDLEVNSYGNIKSYIIQYQDYDKALKRDFTRTEVCTEEKTQTFYNGELHAYPENMNGSGKPVAEWDNEYGFIPMVMASHMLTEQVFGNVVYGEQVDKVNEINDAASLLGDAVRKAVNPAYAVSGADPGTIEVDPDELRDSLTLIGLPMNASMTPLNSPVDIPGTVLHIDKLLEELERDRPELSLHRLRMGGNLTAPGVNAAYSDAGDLVYEAQGNFDAPMITAFQMGIAIGGYRRYDGYQRYGLDSYMRGDLRMSIAERPIIKDRLSKYERVQTLQAGGFKKLLLQELDYPEDVIEEELGRAEEAQRNAIRGLTEGVFGTDNEQEDDDAEPTETQEAEAATEAA